MSGTLEMITSIREEIDELVEDNRILFGPGAMRTIAEEERTNGGEDDADD